MSSIETLILTVVIVVGAFIGPVIVLFLEVRRLQRQVRRLCALYLAVAKRRGIPTDGVEEEMELIRASVEGALKKNPYLFDEGKEVVVALARTHTSGGQDVPPAA